MEDTDGKYAALPLAAAAQNAGYVCEALATHASELNSAFRYSSGRATRRRTPASLYSYKSLLGPYINRCGRATRRRTPCMPLFFV